MSEKLTPKRWQEAEKNIRRAETAKRQVNQASSELYESTGRTKKERAKHDGEYNRVEHKALEREKKNEGVVENLLAEGPEKALVKMQKDNLIKALRASEAIEDKKSELLDEESKILSGIEDSPSGTQQEALEDIRKEIDQAGKERETLLASSPEAFYALNLKDLKDDRESLENGRIAEMPYVKEHIEDIAAHLRGNKPVLIYGHLGSGKTELAMHVARNYVLNERPDLDTKIEDGLQTWKESHPDAPAREEELHRKELEQAHRGAVVISGSKHTALAELYGHQVLAVEEGGGTISDFKLGPIYRAMEEGRPVIIDEVNAIPHEVLISLNHILTRRVGDVINVQQDTGKTVRIKEGFCVMMTGNLNQGQERYVDRQELDPAFLSRLYKVEYDYLPQKTDGSLKEEAGGDNQLFNLLVARVMDKNGNIEAPKDTLNKLWTLAKAARRTQDVFAGREVTGSHWQEAGGRSLPYFLKETVLSMRGLDAVITQWQKDGYKRELDYYLWREFVGQATDAQDRAYLYQQFKDREGFFAKTGGWPDSPKSNLGTISNFNIKPPENAPASRDFLGPRSVVEAVAGKAPERQKWPVVKEGGELDIETMEELEGYQTQLESDIQELEAEVKDFCEI